MSKIITHEANGATHVLIGIPEEAQRFGVNNNGLLSFDIMPTCRMQYVQLIPGQYEIIGVADQLSEVWCIIARSHSLTPSTCLVLRKK